MSNHNCCEQQRPWQLPELCTWLLKSSSLLPDRVTGHCLLHLHGTSQHDRKMILFVLLSLFRKSLSRCRRINRMLSNESVPPSFSRSNSQASMDSTSMEDFWCEVESIKESREDGSEEAMLLEFKPADGEHMNNTHSSYPGFASCPKSHALISSFLVSPQSEQKY